MTDQISYIATAGPGDPLPEGNEAVTFTLCDTLGDLPDAPGLYVILGRGADGGFAPLAFGQVEHSLAAEMPQHPHFHSALKQGLACFGAAPKGDADAARIAALVRAHGAPINAAQDALAEIDRTQAETRTAQRRAAQ